MLVLVHVVFSLSLFRQKKKCFLVVTELCTYSFAYTVYGVHIILVPNVIDTYVNKVYIISSIKSLMVVKKYIKLSIL